MEPIDALIAAFVARAADGTLVDLVLSKNRGVGSDLERITLKPVGVRGEARIALVHRHATRDITRHAPVAAAVAALREWLDPERPAADGVAFAHATLHAADGRWQLLTTRKGAQRWVRHRGPAVAPAAPAAAGHDRAKPRHIALDAPWLHALGVTDDAGRVVPAMARKWKQIDKFVEIVEAARRRSPLAAATRLRVFDYGCGKGYLTFALHDHLRRIGVDAEVTGVDLKADLVDEGNRIARRIGAPGLAFEVGDLRSVPAGVHDVTIALHACDTATDRALDLGIAGGASLLVVSPCCHREIRPQLGAAPAGLAPLLRHGVHRALQAEMLTDTLRTLALEAAGYAADVIEFVALEHTSKNKMIVATRGPGGDAGRVRAAGEIDALKRHWGIREQALEKLVRERAGVAA